MRLQRGWNRGYRKELRDKSEESKKTVLSSKGKRPGVGCFFIAISAVKFAAAPTMPAVAVY